MFAFHSGQSTPKVQQAKRLVLWEYALMFGSKICVEVSFIGVKRLNALRRFLGRSGCSFRSKHYPMSSRSLQAGPLCLGISTEQGK
jgi:hypothetical protein